MFVFLEDAHATTILNSLWRIGASSLVLSRWYTHFDPLQERVKKRNLWVLLPALPFPLWSHSFLEGISNTIGWFIAVEDDFHSIFDKRCAKVLIELDVSKGLPAEVEIQCLDIILV